MKSKTTTGPSKFAKPYISNAANTLQADVTANRDNVAGIQTGLQGALGQLGQSLNGNPLTTAAQGYSQDVLGGKYLNNNPYLDGIIGQTRDNVFNDIAGRFGRAGLSGSDAFGGQLGRKLADAELALRYNDYGAERSRMDAAAANAPGLVNSDLARYGVYAGIADQAAQLPLLNSRTLASGLGGLLGNYNTTTQRPGLGQLLLQGAANAAQSFAGGG